MAAAESFGDRPARLFPAEEAVVARAVEKRRREFATTRGCAREALAELGLPAAPLLRDERGAPQWPDGVVGSLTHCDGYRAAAVARSSEMLTIGIDAEPNGPLPRGVLERISVDSERDQVAELAAADPEIHWDRLLFCCKESAFKAWFPLNRSWLGFRDAEVVIDRAEGTFAVRGFAGRWLVSHGLAVAAIAQPARVDRAPPML